MADVPEQESCPSTAAPPSRTSTRYHDDGPVHPSSAATELHRADDIESGIHAQHLSKAINIKEEKENTALKLTDQTNLLPFRKVVSVFAGLALCLLVSALDMTLIATALPSIATHFHAGELF